MIPHQEIEKVGASAPTHHSEAAPDPNAETESTQGGSQAEEQTAGREEQNQGQSADPGGLFVCLFVYWGERSRTRDNQPILEVCLFVFVCFLFVCCLFVYLGEEQNQGQSADPGGLFVCFCLFFVCLLFVCVFGRGTEPGKIS